MVGLPDGAELEVGFKLTLGVEDGCELVDGAELTVGSADPAVGSELEEGIMLTLGAEDGCELVDGAGLTVGEADVVGDTSAGVSPRGNWVTVPLPLTFVTASHSLSSAIVSSNKIDISSREGPPKSDDNGQVHENGYSSIVMTVVSFVVSSRRRAEAAAAVS